MAQENASIVERVEETLDGAPERPNGNTSGDNADGRPIKIGDIIESEPSKREFREFPNLRNAAPIFTDRGAGAGDTPKRRGRPPGSTNTATTKAPKDLGGIEKMLLSINAGMGLLLSCPELAWNEKEASQVSEYMSDVAKHYDKMIDPKTMAWLNLIGAIGWIEGTKLLAIRARLKRERQDKPPAPLPRPDTIRIVKPNGAPVADANAQRKPSEDPMAYTLNPIRE